MSTQIPLRALLALSLGALPAGRPLEAQAALAIVEGTRSERIEVSYHLQELTRNEEGQYEMAGTIRG